VCDLCGGSGQNHIPYFPNRCSRPVSLDCRRVQDRLGASKARYISDGAEKCHRSQQPDTGELNKKGNTISPGLTHAQASQFLIYLFYQRREVIDDGQVLSSTELLAVGERQAIPPITVSCRKDLPGRRHDIVAHQHTLQAVLPGRTPGRCGRRSLRDQPSAMGYQRPQLPNVMGRHPDFWDDVGRQQASQSHDISLVGLDKRGRDEFY